ncbi:MAG TPA: translation initiation factor IF-3 [Anaerolineae bacterium]|nr:translation initiation factor IF-3 [Anaerolineae bacterium]HMR67044.1 translation initiation factor IF-3 [Anaerolineae bacterium]
MRENRVISTKDERRVNREITSSQVRLIDEKGQQLGVLSIQEALSIATERDTDLVEVAPNANPPVCRLMDYGKFLYEAQKRERDARKSQAKVEIKEIRLRPKTGDHDISYKLKQARGFLEKGAKVKVRLRFRGREVTHPEVALELLDHIADQLQDIAVVEQRPAKEGMTMLMILSPNK